MVKIAFCAGHGGFGVTPGKRTPAGEYEWDFNNKVVLAFVKEISKYENVSLLRTDDSTGKTDVPLITRTNKANSWKADLYISFHHNAYSNNGQWGNWTGVETFVQNGVAGESLALAKAVHPAIVKAYGLKDRGVKHSNLHITRETKMTAILVEGGFMDSTIDIVKLRDGKVLEDAGILIAQAVAKFKNLKLKTTPSTQPSKPSNETTQKPSAKTYKVLKSINGYVNAADAKAKKNKKTTVKKGTYHVFKESQGMINVASKQGVAGSWINPSENVIVANKPSASTPTTTKKYTSIVDYLNANKIDSSINNRKKLATKYGIKNYTGTASQNTQLLNAMQNGKAPVQSAPSQSVTFKVGAKVKIKSSAKKYSRANVNIPSSVKNKTYTIQQVGNNDVLLKEIVSWVKKTDVQ